MRVRVDGGPTVTLGRADFVAAGGEGTVYARDGVAYKVYADPGAIDAGRLRALAALGVDRVVTPMRLLRDDAGAIVGFTMRHLADAVPFPRLCTRAYREAEGVDPGRALQLVDGMRETVAAVHRAGALVVDLNPMNLLAARGHDAVWFIDAASWQLPGYPATAQLDAIRDRHSATLDVGTDWFAFAIVSFQLLVGIHPYRGTHPSLKGLDARMLANASVFRPAVKMPAACFPLDVLPPRWRDWYEAVFERGLRTPPPSVGSLPSWTPTARGGDVDAVPIGRFGAAVRRFAEHGVQVAVTDAAVFVDGDRLDLPGVEAVGFTPAGRPVFAWRDADRLRLADRRGPIAVTLRADALMATRGRLYVRSGDQLVEVLLHDRIRTIASPRIAATVLPHATRLFPGVALQDMLGAVYAHVPLQSGSCHALRLQELDGKRIVDAVCDGTVLAVLVARDGTLDRWTFRFDPGLRRRDLHVDADVTAGLDLVVLDTSVAVRRGEAGLELFAAVPGAADVRRVDAPEGPLVRLGAQLGQIRGQDVVRLVLRAP